MMKHLSRLLAGLLVCLAGVPAKAAQIAYRVSPESKSGQLQAVAVRPDQHRDRGFKTQVPKGRSRPGIDTRSIREIFEIER